MASSDRNPIQQLIDELGPRTAQRVLEILGGPIGCAVYIPAPAMYAGMLYRRARDLGGPIC